MAPVVDLRPLLTGTCGDGIAVAGLRIGDELGKLERSLVTAASGNPAAGLSERIDGVIARGGSLSFGPIALDAEKGRVVRLFVRGEALDALSIHHDSDIVSRFGAPAGIERSFGIWHYHYVDRQVVIGWDQEEKRVEYVALGVDSWEEARFGAAQLLSELLWSFDDFDRIGWVDPQSGSRHTRFRRIAALACALELGTPREVARGTFLERALTPGRTQVLIEIAQKISPEASSAQLSVPTYQRLLAHRVRAEAVIGYNRHLLECSIPVLAGVVVAQEDVGKALRESLKEIDGWLCRLMDPEGRTFAESALISQFGWPDVDVRYQEALED